MHNDIEDIAFAPSGGSWTRGLGGVLAPLALAVYGAFCIATGHATLPGGQTSMVVNGTAAIALAIAYIAFGFFLHFHYFWGLHDRLYRYSQGLKIGALLIFLPCLLFTIYRLVLGQCSCGRANPRLGKASRWLILDHMNWYLENNGISEGPIGEHELAARVRKREVPGDTLAWHPGLDAWQPIQSLQPGWLQAPPAPASTTKPKAATAKTKATTKPHAPSVATDEPKEEKVGFFKRLFGGGKKKD